MRVFGFCLLVLVWIHPAGADDGDGKPAETATDATQAMAEMMAKMARFTQPGEAHKILEKMIGTWDTETRITLPGSPSTGEKGRAVTSWLMPGRWIKTEGTGQLMGQPIQNFSVFGYDNFKQSYVVMSVQSMDTAMHHAEGDMDPGGKAILMYGTIDEYLTGEHDKMVKTVIRMISDDEMVMEIHDLPIGEKNTKVVEVKYTRVKS